MLPNQQNNRKQNMPPFLDDAWVSLSEAAQGVPYSAEYLSLLARRKLLPAKKIRGVWYTTPAIVKEYMRRQMARSLRDSSFAATLSVSVENPDARSGLSSSAKTASSARPDLAAGLPQPSNETLLEPAPLQTEGFASGFPTGISPEEAEKINENIFVENIISHVEDEAAPTPPDDLSEEPAFSVIPSSLSLHPHLKKTQTISDDALDFAEGVVSAVEEEASKKKTWAEVPFSLEGAKQESVLKNDGILKITSEEKMTPSPEDAYAGILFQKFITSFTVFLDKEIEKRESFLSRAWHTVRGAYSAVLSHKKLFSLFLIFLLVFTVLPFRVVSAFFDNAYRTVAAAVNDANTVLGFRPGTHENEILLLDQEGKIAIFGNVETEGQFKSFVEDGIAPIYVKSTTKAENLNADYLDGLSSEEFTLAFVTKNGNVTYDDVFLEGKVAVGQTLLVRGAANLLSSLSVDGELSVFGDTKLHKNLTVDGSSYFKALISAQDIAARNIVANRLNATDVIAETTLTSHGAIIADGNLTIGGQAVVQGFGIFHGGVSGDTGTFRRGVSTGGNLQARGDVELGGSGSEISITSGDLWSIDTEGNAVFGGDVTVRDSLSVSATTSVNRLRAGNLGIGTTTPGYEIGVVGSGLFEGLVIAYEGFVGNTLTATSTLTTQGLASFLSGFISSASSTISATLHVLDALTASSTLVVDGLSTLYGGILSYASSTIAAPLHVLDNLSASSTLTVGGLGIFESGLISSASSSIAGPLYVSDNLSASSTLTVASLATFDSGFISSASSTVSAPLHITDIIAGSSTLVTDQSAYFALQSGSVGIASSTPWGLLSVEMNTTDPAFVVSNQGSSTPSFYIGGVNQNGFIGVGTSTPQAMFHIANDVNADGAGFGEYDPSILFSGTTTATGGDGGGSDYNWIFGVDISDGGKFKIASSTALGTSDRLVIDGAGIGYFTTGLISEASTTISSTLHVSDNFSASSTSLFAGLSLFESGFVTQASSTIGGPFYVQDHLSASSTLTVASLATFEGGAILGGASSTVSGTLSLSRNVIANGGGIDMGDAGTRFGIIYADEVNATTLVGTITGGNSSSTTFTINSENATADENDMFLAFERGTITPNALLQWDSTNKNFIFNFGVVTQASSTVSGPFHVSDNLSASSTLTVASLATFDSGFISSASSTVSAPLHVSDIIAGSSTLVTDQSAYFALTGGNVGIASSTPWGLLSVEMNTTDPAFVVSNQGSSTPSFYIGGVNQNGFIGIGTSTPQAMLHLANDVNADGSGFGENDPSILFSGTTTATGGDGGGSDYNWIFGVDISDGGKFKIASSTALGTSDRLVIDGAGIGYFTTGLISEASTTISSTLHVSDNFSASSTSLFAGLSLFESGFITQASSTIGGPFYVQDHLSASSTLTVASLATFDSGFIGSASSSLASTLHISDAITGSSTLTIDGQCVTGDSELITANGEKLRVDEVKGGEYVYSLDEKTGNLVPAKIVALLDMGVKLIYKIETEDGKTIRTTANHPYLAIQNKEDLFFPRERYQDTQKHNAYKQEGAENIEIYHNIVDIIHNDYLLSDKTINAKLADQNIIEINKPNNSNDQLNSLSTRGLTNIAAKNTNPIFEEISESFDNIQHNDSNARGSVNNLVDSQLLKIAEWTKVRDLAEGDYIAVADDNLEKAQFVKIKTITLLPPEQVYDLSIEGTHNFVANGIIAHNTYLNDLSTVAGVISTASSTVSGPFHVSDNLSASSTLTVASLATFDSGFISGASSTVSAPLHVSDIITGSSTIAIDKDAYFALQSGSVGIASSTPWGLLSVEMNTTDPAFVVSNQGSTTPSFYIGGVNQNGFIGVGTSTPLSLLHIANNLQNDENGGGFGEYDPAILLTGTTTSVLEAGSDYNWIFGVDISDGGKFKVASSTALGTNDRFVIDGAGIGYFTAGLISEASTTISSTLHVSDNFSASSTSLFAGLSLFESGFITQASSTIGGPFYVLDNLSASSTLTVASLATFDSGFISSASSTVSAPLHVSDIIAGSSTLVTDQSAYFALQSGSVGIASSTPWGLLSVEMNTTDPAFVVSNQGSSTPSFYIGGVNQNGFIGVGTSTPQAMFHIANDVNADGSGFGENDPSILFSGTTTATGGDGGGSDYNWIFGVDISDGGKFKIASSTALGTSDRFVIDGAGIGYFTTGLISEASTTISSTLHVSDNFSASSTSLFAGLSLFESGFITQASSTIGGPLYVLDNLSASSTLTVASLATFDSGFISSASSTVSAPLHVLDNLSGSSTLTIDGRVYFGDSVGIGTTSPSATLAVTNATGEYSFWVNDTTTDTTPFVIDGSGNVGIGTTNPQALLDVLGAASSTSLIIDGASSDAPITFRTNLVVETGGTPLHAWTIGADQSDGGKFKIASSTALETNDRFVIDGAGNVGIGTASPGALLSFGTPVSANTIFLHDGTGDKYGLGMASGAMRIFSGVVGSTNLVFGSYDGTTFTENVRFEEGGNVGIGTTTPGARLAVNQSDADPALPAFLVSDSTDPDSTPFIIDASGNVGIGSTSPAYHLSLESDLDNQLMVTGKGTGFGGSLLANIHSERTSAGPGGNALLKVGSAFAPNILFVDDIGRVGIGTASPADNFEIKEASGVPVIVLDHTGETSSFSAISFRDDGSAGGDLRFDQNGTGANYFDFTDASGVSKLQIDIDNSRVGVARTPTTDAFEVSGVMSFTSDTALSATTLCVKDSTLNEITICSSLAKYKENIEKLSLGLETVAALRPVEFNWKSSGKRDLGFIAEEVEAVNPLLAEYGISEDGTPLLSGVKYSQLTALLVKAMQEIGWRVGIASGSPTTTPSLVIDEDGFVSTAKNFIAGKTLYVRDDTGFVGIGTSTPNYPLQVAGDIAANSFINVSARDTKKDITEISVENSDARTGLAEQGPSLLEFSTASSRILDTQYSILDTLKNLPLFTYRYTYEAPDAPLRMGLIAEKSPAEVLSSDKKGVDLYKLVTFTIGGVKELINSVERLAFRVDAVIESVVALTEKTESYDARLALLEERVTAVENLSPRSDLFPSAENASSSRSDLAAGLPQPSENPSLLEFSTATSTIPDTGYSILDTINEVIASFADFGLTIADGVANFAKLVVNELLVQKLVVENITARALTLGSAENRAGITMYDKNTGEPYCLSVAGGNVVTAAGTCEQQNTADSSQAQNDVILSTLNDTTPVTPNVTTPVTLNDTTPVTLNDSEGSLGSSVPSVVATPQDDSEATTTIETILIEETTTATEPIVEEQTASPVTETAELATTTEIVLIEETATTTQDGI